MGEGDEARVVLIGAQEGIDQQFGRTGVVQACSSHSNIFSGSYRSELIGNLIPDLIVDDAVIVDPKVAACFTDTHIAQMLRYLNITALDLALLLNFKNARLEWKRVLRTREAGEHDTPDLHG